MYGDVGTCIHSCHQVALLHSPLVQEIGQIVQHIILPASPLLPPQHASDFAIYAAQILIPFIHNENRVP